jgi:hypothetical protein
MTAPAKDPLRPFAHLTDAELDALRNDDTHPDRGQIALEGLARRGMIRDSGERRNGQIVWVPTQ